MSISVVQRFTDICVASARRRWPVELSDDMARTWLAELAVLRLTSGVPAPKRWWRQVTFAASLAVSPSPHGERSMSEVWSGRLAGLGRAGLTLVSAVGVVLLAVVAPLYMANLAGNLDQHVSESVLAFVPVVALALSVAMMWWLGSVIGRRSATEQPAGQHDRDQRSIVAEVVPRMVALGLAFALILPGFHPNWGGGVDVTNQADVLRGVAVWTVIAAVVTVLVVRSIRRGRRLAAYAYGIGGTLVALDIAVIVGGWGYAHRAGVGAAAAVTWFPRAVFDPGIGSSIGIGPQLYEARITHDFLVTISGYQAHGMNLLAQGVQGFAGALLVGTVFAVAYALRAAQTVAAQAEGPRTGATETYAGRAAQPGTAGNRVAVRRVAAAFAVAGVLAWAWVTTLTPVAPPAGPSGLVFPSERLAWLGILAVVLVVLAVVLLNAGRGPVAAPAVAVFVVLTGTQVAVLAAGWSGAAGAVPTVVIGLAAVAGSWWLTQWLTRALAGPGEATGVPPLAVRRALVAVAVAAILVVPTGLGLEIVAPMGYLAVGYVLAVLGWLIAITAALASRPVPLSRIAATVLVVVPIAAVVVFESGAATGPLYWFDPRFFMQAVLAVVTLAAARWTRAGAGTVARWIALGVAAAIVSVTVARSSQFLPEFLFEPLTLWDRVQPDFSTFDATEPSQILMALSVGLFASRWAFPPDPATAANKPARVDPSDPVDQRSGAQIVTA
jgi:hypothetical protein